MAGKIKLLAAAFALMFLLASAAAADYYMFQDGEGHVTLTDDINKVPLIYRNNVNVLRDEDARTHGYVPTVSEALSGEQTGREDWYDYRAMPFYTRWILLARAGTFDLGPTIRSMSTFVTLSLVVLGALWFFIFRVFEQKRLKGLLIFLVLGGICCTVFFRYLGAVQARSEQVRHAVSRATKLSKESREELMGLLASLKAEGDLGLDIENTLPGMANLPSGER